MIITTRSKLKKRFLLKNKIFGSKNSSGRNNSGKISVFHRGGGHKRKLRFLKFTNQVDTGIIINIEYDPNRNSYIGVVYSLNNNDYYYILLAKNNTLGDIVNFGFKNKNIKLGNSLLLKNIPLGSYIHNISLNCNTKSVLSRSAGTYSILLEKKNSMCTLKLSSGQNINLSNTCFGTLGIVSINNSRTINKAGYSRWLNKRPKVRGVAMNPVDHPHGGGEGKTSGRVAKVTPWGKSTKGKSTSNSKRK